MGRTEILGKLSKIWGIRGYITSLDFFVSTTGTTQKHNIILQIKDIVSVNFFPNYKQNSIPVSFSTFSIGRTCIRLTLNFAFEFLLHFFLHSFLSLSHMISKISMTTPTLWPTTRMTKIPLMSSKVIVAKFVRIRHQTPKL